VLRKLCLPFSPYRQRPDITIHGPGVPRTVIPVQHPASMSSQVRCGRRTVTSPVSGELTARPGDFEHPTASSACRLAETSPAFYQTQAPDKLPSAQSSYESPIRRVPCASCVAGTPAQPVCQRLRPARPGH